MTGSIRPCSKSEAGFMLAELIFGVIFIALASSVLIAHLASTYRATQAHRDKVFAYATAQSILDELEALAAGAADPNTFDLLSYDDGTVAKPTLTISAKGGIPVLPDHPNSRNIARNGEWLWTRHISVRAMPGAANRNLRYVTVTVFKKDGAGIQRPMASLSSVVNSNVEGYPSTQTFDVFLLALESVPGWWVNMEAIQSFVDSTLMDLESRNSGLEFRTHWITKASYGRNPVYRPYLNVLADTLQDIPQAYFYPGLMPSGGAINYYYSPERFKARIATDNGQINGYDPVLNPYPYAVSDFYNHAMRLPQERALHNLRVAEVRQRKQDIQDAILGGFVPPPELEDMSEEPTLRLFLEDLNSNPDKYRHAIIINLHGELVPLPALRNYSDAAKQPRSLPGVRVVTHPEQLRTERPTGLLPGEDVVLRVYAYTADPLEYTGPDIMPDSTHLIQLEIPGLDLTLDGGPELHPSVEIENLAGGVMVGGTDNYFPFTPAKLATDPSLVPGEMCYLASLVDDGPGLEKKTVIWLYNTPVVAPEKNNRGLKEDMRSRLYYLEYIPSCTEAAGDFSRNLYSFGDGPKNTARWTIKIPKTVFGSGQFINNFGIYYNAIGDVELAIRTRIWDMGMVDPSSSGVMYPLAVDPENLSVTYTWWADSPNDVPITERSQFLGDPRHNPYKDLLHGDPDFPDGYNWYHDKLNKSGNSAANYPGLDSARLENCWDARVRADIPRMFEVFRRGLVESATVYTSLTGWSYYYAGFGNEMGADANNGYPDSLPMNLRPFGDPGKTGFINNITPREGGKNTGGRRFIVDDQKRWYGMPWLGEFYPDEVYSTQWIALDGDGEIRGNLDAGKNNGEFFRNIEEDAHNDSPYQGDGTILQRSEQRTHGNGCTAFFNIGTTGQTFHHKSKDGQTGDLVGPGLELGTNYGLVLPTTTEISRPFGLTEGNAAGPEFSLAPYSTNKFNADMFRTYYDHQSNMTGSGLVQLTDPGDRSSAFIVVNGLNPSVDLGTAEIAKYSILSTIHSLFEAGDSTLAHRIPQTPQLAIISPTETSEIPDPVAVDVLFDIQWVRWDGQKYTTLTSPTFTEDEGALEYVMLYSKNNGQTWLHMRDSSVATPGVRPINPVYIEPDIVAGPETYTWDVGFGYPEGLYLVRVEVYRNNQNLHYAYHQVRCFIDR